MRNITLGIALAYIAGLGTSPLAAQGRLMLLDRGTYVCALPGDATGSAWVEQSGREFTIEGGSSYDTPRGGGTYLMEGRQVIFTRGPMRGMKLMLLSSGLLQEIGRDGKLARLRCHRTGARS